ncbi:MAG: cell wall-binding repeat-containing protein, partial [Coriobacteriia bacterium]|nr:cell wall-binding repeat-containing protein [Coriobacteriia bacterium]
MSIRRAGTIRWLRATLAVALLVAMQPIPVAVGAEQALAAQVAATRVAGLIAPENQRVGSANRFTNSVLLAQQGWTSSEYVVIATGRGWSDALVGTPLAATLKAPLLLSERTALPAVVKAEIKRLGASRAIILGGTGALASGIVDDLVECGITRRYVERIGGADRYVTASKVARRIHSLSDGEGWVALVSGERFTDALSVGPWAGALGAPIVLTKKSSIPATTKTVLTALHPKAVLIVGGSRSIGAKVTKQIPVQWRIAGVDSYDTANLMAEFASDHDFDFDNVYVVSGTDWSSSLSLGALSARTMGLIMPTDPTRLDIHTHAFFDGHCSSIKEIISVGGPGWVAPSVMTEIQQASHTHLNTESLTLITGDLLTAFDGVTTETVTFDDVPVAVTTVVPGQYLVLNRSGARPDDDPLKPGFVRQVLSVEDVGDSLVATTRDAALTEILQKGSVDIQVVPISAQDVRNQYL